ncbi:nitroreductase family protein [Mycoplasma todarodis]|uniref:Nitroreductase domain-containing protein n=1 Tax=Mycoplasma todarodis TaxID=1937191 RepID=A0A4R0XTM0_9MOLU|nr:nitroreductase family protein [Mycoplasma todarodis]TCG10989.1 hypothetical protein C4B25_02505 [Mycoplasma todarodis]
MNKIIKEINNRQTVKAYSNKKIPKEDWQQILETIYWTPSSHGFEPYRVLIIEKSNAIRTKLKPLMWNQGVVTEADKIIFFISLKRSEFTDDQWMFERSYRRFYEVAGKTKEESNVAAQKMATTIKNKHLDADEPNGDEWAMKQCYIALGTSLIAATILGIGSTPMEGLEKEKVEKLFKSEGLMSEGERVAVAASFGYPASKTSYLHYGTNKRVRDDWSKKFKTI